ncbi:aminoacyl-histidine dipeptidase [Helicobacter muridarum]|uniref:Aminoacyl-histidine dipeptidase n=1 Tax=Helicobacter muridarum TaxID=216 RepID=A0A099TYE4_9HELI|nr:M28 family peptidase [Helicobacter muridarum]TLE01339.1 aminoacyl-histidine dipeptidase [Helicobacter muridarum]STQ85258.1 aminoacyl-histidine dipeptidase [Helicobacter muridarum]
MLNEILPIFYKLTTIPHGSGDTAQMQSFIESFAKKHGYAFKHDKARNLLVYKEDKKPFICLQSHYDMVCVGVAMNKSPLTLISNKTIDNGIEKTWLKAQDSSLGADNGMGIAIMMYFMTQGANIEFLFTNDEEIGMIGAKNLEIPIQSKILINLDSEVLGEITVGCAGGFDFSFTSDFETQEINPDYYYYVLQTCGFAGGHSGLDINNTKPEYQNAILSSTDFLYEIVQSYKQTESNIANAQEFYIINWEGGEKRNSIPINSKIILATSKQLDLGLLNDKCPQFFGVQELEEYRSNDKLHSVNDTFLDTLYAVPFETLYSVIKSLNIGVLESKGEYVQNSLSLSHIFFANGHLKLSFMGRANTKALLDSNLENLKITLAQSYKNQIPNSATFKMSEYYVPWEKQESSLLESRECNDSKEIIDSMLHSMQTNLASMGIKPKVVELHAGLECGVLLACLQEMGLKDIVALSIGPTINSPHSLNECVWIESVEVILLILRDFISKYK